MTKHIFSIYHPYVLIVYFFGMVICSMITYHPGMVILAFACVSLYYCFLEGPRKYLSSLKYLSVMIIVIGVLNAVFNQSGSTVLFYWPGGAKFTCESLLYGIVTGLLITSVTLWFFCYHSVVSSEKFLFVFGKAWPGIALMFSMIFRFVPDMLKKGNDIRDAQDALYGVSALSKKDRLRRSVRLNSVLMGWSMENSIDTTDSMQCRGFGCTKRTSYTEYRLHGYDTAAFIVIITLMAAVIYFFININTVLSYYPSLTGFEADWWIYAAYTLLLLFPLIIEFLEYIRCINLK